MPFLAFFASWREFPKFCARRGEVMGSESNGRLSSLSCGSRSHNSHQQAFVDKKLTRFITEGQAPARTNRLKRSWTANRCTESVCPPQADTPCRLKPPPGDQVAAHFDALTASTIATMPALTASGRVGQASFIRCRPGSSTGHGAPCAPDSAPPGLEIGGFFEDSRWCSLPLGGT